MHKNKAIILECMESHLWMYVLTMRIYAGVLVFTVLTMADIVLPLSVKVNELEEAKMAAMWMGEQSKEEDW